MAQPQQTNNPHFSNIQQAPNQAAAQSGQPTNPQGQQQPNRSQQEHRFTSKVRELVSGPLKEKWAATCREGAAKLYVNGILDSNVGAPPQRFDENTFESNLEDFYAICDQIEANLKCALEVHNISTSSTRYMSIQPCPSKLDLQANANTSVNPEYLNYPQYIATSKQQIQFAQEMKQQLNQAAVDVVLGHNAQTNK
jgi:mediator of RNA polymerase II transcription subunit 29